MSNLSRFLDRISNWKTLVGLILLYVLFVAVLLSNAEAKMNQLAGKEVGVIDLTMGFNPDRALRMVAEYGDEGRNYYKQTELTLDLIYPLIYTFLAIVALTLVYRKLLRRPVQYLNLLPFVVLILDYLENVTVVSMLSHYPEQSHFMAILCETFKLIKFLVLGLVVFLLLYGLVKLIFRRK